MELKPCPFCGGEVEMEWNFHTDTYCIYCKNCECYVDQHETVADEAEKAWNRRADNDVVR